MPGSEAADIAQLSSTSPTSLHVLKVLLTGQLRRRNSGTFAGVAQKLNEI